MDSAFEYIRDNKGIDKELYYPYYPRGRAVMHILVLPGADVTGYVDLEKRDEQALKMAVATQGPISVIIDASHHSHSH